MLELCYGIRDLDFRQLMDVYEETNTISGRMNYPKEPENLRLLFAEQDFYRYLELFFQFPGAVYALWVESDRYMAALRLEEYQDGLLITALETHPAARRRGYATKLLQSVKEHFHMVLNRPLYSHVQKKNLPSMRTHQTCGFCIAKELAVFLDGTVHRDHYTLIWK